jgi:aryl-alcohol dehydrogenase-like predicted oxidoreductase
MATDDWRRGAAEFNPSNLDLNIALRDALKPTAQRHRTSVSSVAIAWVLSWPGVTAAIVGGRSPEQVDGWIGAGNLELGRLPLTKSRAIKRTGAGSGPSTPNLESAGRKSAA